MRQRLLKPRRRIPHERAGPLPLHNRSLLDQLLDRFAHGGAGQTGDISDLAFWRQRRVGRQNAILYSLLQPLPQTHVSRPTAGFEPLIRGKKRRRIHCVCSF